MSVCKYIFKFLLEKLTQSEKYSTLTKIISSNINKYFWLNFLFLGVSINIKYPFSYINFENELEISDYILMSMFLSVFTEHLSPIFSYLKNLFQRFLDSKYKNGKSTKLNIKSKYEELYIGPEFPIGKRYSSIFVNLAICFLYGTFCPLMFLLFTLLLITTFMVDKFLIINYYKKPQYYDHYLSKHFSNFLFYSIILYFYFTIYQISNPYLFNYLQNNSFEVDEKKRNSLLYI